MNLEELQEMNRKIKEERAEVRRVLAEIREKCDLEQLMAEAKFKPREVAYLEPPYDKAIMMPLKDYEGQKMGNIVVYRNAVIIRYKGKRYVDHRDGKPFLQALGLFKREYAAVQGLMEEIKQEKERQKGFWQDWQAWVNEVKAYAAEQR